MYLPPSERRNEIHFYIAKGLSYPQRLAIALGLIGLGLIVQAGLFLSGFWVIGLVMVFAGVLLLLVKGYENKATPQAAEDWRPVTRSEFERILQINVEQKKWDRSWTDITCGRGFFLLVVVGGLLALLFLVASSFDFRLGVMLLANAGALVLPFWFTGVRFILKNDNLIVKTKMLLHLESQFSSHFKKDGEAFQFQLQTARTKDRDEQEVPVDVKAILAFSKAPSSFLGVQMQISINMVQGTSYPYFYCVLVAKPEFGGLKRKGPPPISKKIVLEPKRHGDVDIMVIRQRTTKTSGYHTKPSTVQQILLYALNLARAAITAQ